MVSQDSTDAGSSNLLDVARSFAGDQLVVDSPCADLVSRMLFRLNVPTVELENDAELGFTGHAMWQGTSFAAAIVTGAIAARTVPGKVSAAEALQSLLDDPDPEPLVRRYTGPP
jgi:cobalamin biosynthesis protein CobT